MNSYKILKEISSIIYANLKSEKDIEKRLNDYVESIHLQISEDFASLFGERLKLTDFKIYVDDENYRQSATGIILNECILNNENIKIRIECLIDNNKIWIKIKEGKEYSEFNNIFNRIEKAQNIEGLSELSEIE